MNRRDTPLILNVNDDEANRYVLSRILRKASFEVIEVGTGEEAMAKVSERPDLVVLDVRLPDSSGFEICRKIKADEAWARTAILMISAHFTRTENRVEGLEGGADGYLVQPVEEAELVATVRALLRLKRAEDEATLVAAEWLTTFDTIGDPICLLGADGTVSRANRAMGTLLQRAPAQLTGASFGELLRETFPAISAHALEHLTRLDGREVFELNAGARWFRISADPVISNGKVTGAVRVLVDVTDRKHLEDELRRRAEDLATMDRRKDEFLGMLAHELRNPLAAITPALHLIDKHASEADRTAAYRELAIRQTRHLAQLVDDLLDVSRITRGKVQLRLAKLELSEIVARAVQVANEAAKEKGHALEVRLSGDRMFLQGDPARIEQIVAHLLDNAIKYTPLGGRISLTVTARRVGERDWVELTVRDNGVGIEKENLERVFDLFAQLDVGIDRNRAGLGVGLSLTQKLVQLHGGKVRAESEGRGMGARFVVELPLTERIAAPESRASEPAAPASSPPPAAAPPADIGGRPAVAPKPPTAPAGRRVLLVEDNEDARDALRDLLEVWGHSVEIAADGEEGETAALERPPEIALIDVGLPRIDGYELARRLRASAAGKNIYLVALTGYGGAEQKTRALSAGFDLHVVKPVAPEKLSELIRLAPVRGVG